MLRALGGLMLFAALGAAPSPALAAEPTPTELAVARRLFKEAEELERQQQWDQAMAKLRQAIRVKATPGLRFHLAYCQENLGLLVEAQLDYDRAWDMIRAGAEAPDTEALLPAARQRLARRVPAIVIALPPGVSNASAAIDDHAVAPSVLGRPAPVNPGTHRVRVGAPGYADFEAEVTVTEGERRVVNVALRPETKPEPGTVASPPATPKSSAKRDDHGYSTRTYVMVAEAAVTVSALAVGVTFLIAGSRADERVARHNDRVDADAERAGVPPRCDNATGDLFDSCQDLATAIDDRNRYELFSTAGFVGAGVGAAALLATYALWPSPKAKASVTPTVDSTSFGLTATMHF